MVLGFRVLELHKRFPLVISRGAFGSSHNLFLLVSDGVHEGVGELAPAIASNWTAESGEAQLRALETEVAALGPELDEAGIERMWSLMRDREIDPPAMAALDVALWDLLAKRRGLPLYRLFGLSKPTVTTSVTIGLNPPQVTRERVPVILESTRAKCLKIKLGSPEGRDFDRAHFLAAAEASAPFGTRLRVDANGGWTVPEANQMIPWLAERGVEYVEQPLAEGQEEEMSAVFRERRLPIFLDESCRFATDVAALADRCDGVNAKLMKCGGLTDARRIVREARARGLKTMLGCMSESSIAIAAGASIGAEFDHLDLDSHLNLAPDPADGAPITDGVVAPTNRPGHGGLLLA